MTPEETQPRNVPGTQNAIPGPPRKEGNLFRGFFRGSGVACPDGRRFTRERREEKTMKQTQAGLTYRVDHVVGELEDQDGIGTEAAAVGLRLGLAIYEELRAIRAALEGRD